MNDLFLDNFPWSKIRFGIGIVSLIAAVSYFFTYFGDLHFLNYLFIIVFTFTGVMHMTNEFGTLKTYVLIKDSYLKIKWFNKMRQISVSDSEIENICLQRAMIIINRNIRKPVKLTLQPFERGQKTKIYNFFIEYAGAKNLTLLKNFN